MASSVKKIFTTLFLTVLILTVGMLMIEFVNVQIYSIEIAHLSKLSCEKALTLFAQETYKQYEGETSADTGGMINLGNRDITDKYGSTYIASNVYPSGSAQAVYNSLYESNTSFHSWLKNVAGDGYASGETPWKVTTIMNRYYNYGARNGSEEALLNAVLGSYSTNSGTGSISNSNSSTINRIHLDNYLATSLGNAYKESLVTPLNFGIPYMDENTVQKIYRWNLGMLVSNCSREAIYEDGTLRPGDNRAVHRNGFLVYANEATIGADSNADDGIAYEIISPDSPNYESRINELVNINMQAIEDAYVNSSVGSVPTSLDELLGTSASGGDERKTVCILKVDYRVPIGYEGVTPLMNIYNYVFRQDSTGMGGRDGVRGFNEATDHFDADLQTFQQGKEVLQGGGTGGMTAGSISAGRLNFCLVR